MNIRDLQYIVAVADCLHIGKAARSCFVSQPALSMQLKNLEKILGVQLFERENKKIIVTDVGREIIERSRKILLEVQEIKQIAQNAQDPFQGNFKLGAFPTLAPYLFPRIVPGIVKQYPNLKLLLIEEKTDVLINQLKNGDIDAALLALPIHEKSFQCLPLFTDPFLIALSKQHKQGKRKTIRLEELYHENVLLLDEGHCLRDQALDVCSMVGLSEQPDFRASSLETLRQMVVMNIGITLIPKIAMKPKDGLTYIPFESTPVHRKIGLFWRLTSSKKVFFEEFSKIIIQKQKFEE